MIRPTRAQLLRTVHIQIALTELQDEDQKEQVRTYNMHHNGEWRDVYAAEEDPMPPYQWEWIENPKKRSNVQGATLELLKELHAYLSKRKIRIKEMFQPYCAFGPGLRVDPETLLQALHRFHLAEDLTLSDVLAVMVCFDQRCNGTVLLTDFQLIMDRVAKLPPPVEERAAEPPAGRSVVGSTIQAVSPSHKLFGSSFKRFLGALDETVPRDKPKHSVAVPAGRSSMTETQARPTMIMMETA